MIMDCKLIPCPFCGGKAETGTFVERVKCTVCGARTVECATMEEAIGMWNRRTEIKCGTCKHLHLDEFGSDYVCVYGESGECRKRNMWEVKE